MRILWCFLTGLGAGSLIVWKGAWLLEPQNASVVTLLGLAVTAYLACYAITWAKYEFHITRQSQQMSVLAALCATENRKSFGPALAEMTRKKLPRHPTLFTPRIIFASLFASPNDEDYLTEDNRDTIDMVARILLGFDEWEHVDLTGINLNGADLWCAKLNGVILSYANLRGTKLGGAKLNEAQLRGAFLIDANMDTADLTKADLAGAKLIGASLVWAYLTEADLQWAELTGANLMAFNSEGANFARANLLNIRLDNPCSDATPESFCAMFYEAKTLYEAILPDDAEVLLRKEYPRLFEKPKNEQPPFRSKQA